MNNYYIYEVNAYSIESLIIKIKQNKIKVLELKKIDDYIYHLKISFKDNLKFKKVFLDAKLLKTQGLLFILKNRLIQKITLISLLISIFYYCFLSTLLSKINIYGNNSLINEEIKITLDNLNIKTMKKIPSEDILFDFKNKFLQTHYEIENLEYKIRGTILNVTYYLKEKENNHFQNIGKYYAKKSGIIKYVDIEMGNFLYHTNDYVKKDSLLIDDYLYLNDKKIYIGAFGKVYANTWQTIEFKEKTNNREESEIYYFFINKARYLIAKEFTDDEKIENEMILNFNYNNDYSSIKVHYTLLENIAFIK